MNDIRNNANGDTTMTAATANIGDTFISHVAGYEFTRTITNITDKHIIFETSTNSGSARRSTKSRLSHKVFTENFSSGKFTAEASASYAVKGKDCTAHTNCTKAQAEERRDQLNADRNLSHLQPFTIEAN